MSDDRSSKEVTPLLQRLTDACNGHPYAKIAWPHRLLHEARDEIERLTRERDGLISTLIEAMAVCAPAKGFAIEFRAWQQRARAELSGEHSPSETNGEREPVAFVGYVNEQPDIIYPGTTRLEGRRYLPIWRPEDHPCARRDAPSEIRVGDTVTMERYRRRGEHEGWIVTWIRDTPDGKFYDVRHPMGGATSASADEIRLSQKAKEGNNP